MNKSWRDTLPVHPAADLFPTMSESELRELGEDIRKNGQKSQIVLWRDENGQINLIDGRSRLDAIELIGETVTVKDRLPSVPWRFLEGDPYDIALSLNVHRRHLTADQKRDLIAKLLKAKPAASDRQIAKQTNSSPTTVGTVRKGTEKAGDVSKLDTRTDTKGRKQPSTKPKKATAKLNGQHIDVGKLSPKAQSAIAAQTADVVRLDARQRAKDDTAKIILDTHKDEVDASKLYLRFFKRACDQFLPRLNKDDAAKARLYFNERTAAAS